MSYLIFNMIETRYKYALIDMSYILYRNAFAASSGKGVGEYGTPDIIRITIQTINKCARDYGITADKYIFLYDKWDRVLGGYYRTYVLKGLYKDDRKKNYVSEEDVENMKKDPTTDPKALEEAEKKLYFNKVCKDAKWTMVRELKNFGLPSLGVEGWEFDDLAWLSACLLYDDSGAPVKPSVIITKDSDLMYSLTPQMEYFKIPTGGSSPKIITYDEMYQTIPADLQGKVSLYDYRALHESLGDGHNNMRGTKKNGVNTEDAIRHIIMGDYSDVEDLEGFKTRMSTFNLGNFPRFEEAKRVVLDLFSTVGRLGTLAEFRSFCEKYGIEKISDRYFTEFISRFDPKLFSER